MDRETLRNQAAGRRNYAEDEAPRKVKWTCRFCDHPFASERLYMSHHCREGDRYEKLRTPTGQAAFAYYNEWMKLSRRSIQPIETFSASSFYSAFIKFSEWVKKVHLPNPLGFIRLMVQEKIQPTLWARDNTYALYVQSYDTAVPPEQQFLQSLELAHQLAKEKKIPVSAIFHELGVEQLLQLIQERKLSSWFLVASKAFRDFMATLDEAGRDRLEGAVQVGAMIMRIQQSPESIEFFRLFSEVTEKEGL
jgi:hypothetical protein